MSGHRHTVLAIAGAVVLATGIAAGQAKPPAPVSPRPAAERPNDEGAAAKAPAKLVAPFRGEAELQYTKPVPKRSGNSGIL